MTYYNISALNTTLRLFIEEIQCVPCYNLCSQIELHCSCSVYSNLQEITAFFVLDVSQHIRELRKRDFVYSATSGKNQSRLRRGFLFWFGRTYCVALQIPVQLAAYLLLNKAVSIQASRKFSTLHVIYVVGLE